MEKFELNPFLHPFYEHIKASKAGFTYNPWAFKCQMNFLDQRIKLEKEVDRLISEAPETGAPSYYVVDRSIFEDNEIFAKNNLDSGLMTQQEYSDYLQVYTAGIDELRPPDLVIILNQDVQVLLDRILTRGRDMEKDMSLDYLANLQHRYTHALEPFLALRGVPFVKVSPKDLLETELMNQQVADLIVQRNTKLATNKAPQ